MEKGGGHRRVGLGPQGIVTYVDRGGSVVTQVGVHRGQGWTYTDN